MSVRDGLEGGLQVGEGFYAVDFACFDEITAQLPRNAHAGY